MSLLYNGYFYYITIGLQVICVIHCLRKGNQNKWIWIIVFLPIVGCIAYIFTEIFTRGDIQHLQSGVGSVFNPTGRIRRLEENVRFANTFNNRIMLADAYLAAGRVEAAIELYESSLVGAFTENEHVHMQLIVAYFERKEYGKLLPLAGKIYTIPQFARSRAHLRYAIALEYTGQVERAEQEFRKMKGRFSYFEPRYEYGLFLQRAGRTEEARHIFAEIAEESRHLSPRERRSNREWIAQAREEMKK